MIVLLDIFKLPSTYEDLLAMTLLSLVYWIITGITASVSSHIERGLMYVRVPSTKDSWLTYLLRGPSKSYISSAIYDVIVIPFVEECLFIGLPLVLFGPLASLLSALLLFGLLHLVPVIQGLKLINASPDVVRRTVVANLVYYVPAGFAAWLMWVSGYGWLSMIFHMIINARSAAEEIIRRRRRLAFLEQAKRKKHAPYVESYV